MSRVANATSHHGVDAPGFRGQFHEPHRNVELQVLELLEVDAAAAGFNLAELRGIRLREVAVLVPGTDVKAVVVFPRGESDQELVPFPTAGRLVVILPVADDGRRPHAGHHGRRELRHGFADCLVQGRHRVAAIGREGGEEFVEGGKCLGIRPTGKRHSGHAGTDNLTLVTSSGMILSQQTRARKKDWAAVKNAGCQTTKGCSTQLK